MNCKVQVQPNSSSSSVGSGSSLGALKSRTSTPARSRNIMTRRRQKEFWDSIPHEVLLMLMGSAESFSDLVSLAGTNRLFYSLFETYKQSILRQVARRLINPVLLDVLELRRKGHPDCEMALSTKPNTILPAEVCYLHTLAEDLTVFYFRIVLYSLRCFCMHSMCWEQWHVYVDEDLWDELFHEAPFSEPHRVYSADNWLQCKLEPKDRRIREAMVRDRGEDMTKKARDKMAVHGFVKEVMAGENGAGDQMAKRLLPLISEDGNIPDEPNEWRYDYDDFVEVREMILMK